MFHIATIHGVRIDSRLCLIKEERLMAMMIAMMSPEYRRHITDMFCDSKACAVYEVSLRSPLLADFIGEWMSDWLIDSPQKGHNGITLHLGHWLEPDSEVVFTVDPDWRMDRGGFLAS